MMLPPLSWRFIAVNPRNGSRLPLAMRCALISSYVVVAKCVLAMMSSPRCSRTLTASWVWPPWPPPSNRPWTTPS
eukprot:1249440-Pyramimonas_sp.AAC.1